MLHLLDGDGDGDGNGDRDRDKDGDRDGDENGERDRDKDGDRDGDQYILLLLLQFKVNKKSANCTAWTLVMPRRYRWPIFIFLS